jgi:hypothetical protein
MTGLNTRVRPCLTQIIHLTVALNTMELMWEEMVPVDIIGMDAISVIPVLPQYMIQPIRVSVVYRTLINLVD